MNQEEEIVDVYYVVQPLHYFVKFCGLWPHTMKRSTPGISTANLLWYFFVFAVYIYVFYLNIDKEFWDSFIEGTNSSIQAYGNWMQVLSGLLIAMIALLVAITTFRKQWTFFETLKNVDDVLSKDFAVLTPKKIARTITYLVLVFVCYILVVITVTSFYAYYEVLGFLPYAVSISYLLSNMPYFCIIMVYYFSTVSITRRFYYINNIMRQIAPQDIPKKTFELCSRTVKNDRLKPTIELSEIYSIYGSYLKKSMPLTPPNKNFNYQDDIKKEIKNLTVKLEKREETFWEKLRRRSIIEVEEFKFANLKNSDEVVEHLTKLLDIHDNLLDCINLQNEILSFQILLMVAQIFVFEVFALFSLYRTMYTSDVESNSITIFMNVSWLALYNIILFVIMHTAAKCVNEGKLTGTYCHKVINKVSHSVDPRIIEKLSVMSHQLTMRTPNITCGLFSFDWELLFSMVSATTIYLVFLMQFDVAANANKGESA